MHSEPRAGRPRSEAARRAVLNAADDLLVEVGYGAMTMKGIAEKAGVGRQTVYRWWSTKAEILFEAIGYDAPQELAVVASGSPQRDLRSFLDLLVRFLSTSDAGAAYRALLGEAQHDTEVAALVASRDVVADSAREAVLAARPGLTARAADKAVALLVGPVIFWILSGRDPATLPVREIVAAVLA